jgi:hypothetical protein
MDMLQQPGTTIKRINVAVTFQNCSWQIPGLNLGKGHWSSALRFLVLPLSPTKNILEWSRTCSVKQKWLEFIQFGIINNMQCQKSEKTIITIYLQVPDIRVASLGFCWTVRNVMMCHLTCSFCWTVRNVTLCHLTCSFCHFKGPLSQAI